VNKDQIAERRARIARRAAAENWEYLRQAQRSEAGCPACCDNRSRFVMTGSRAGQSVRADFDVQMPEARGWAHVDVEPGPSAKRVRTTHEGKGGLTVAIGQRPRQPHEIIR
jgi:hypothetical protein